MYWCKGISKMKKDRPANYFLEHKNIKREQQQQQLQQAKHYRPGQSRMRKNIRIYYTHESSRIKCNI
jgi:hypothetical protein